MSGALPMSRFRVLELGAAVAAPFCCSLLADAGAEVIKVETAKRPDNLRGNWPMHQGVTNREHSYYYNIMNRNKLGLTLDLTRTEGRETFLSLVSISDVVVENFAAGTMARLGLPFEALRRANPGVIMLSMSGFGATGPAKDYIAYGMLLEAVTGMAWLGGYESGPPVHSAFVYTDYCSAMYAANLVLGALLGRSATGEGACFDLSQAEVSLHLAPDAVLEAAVNGSVPQKREDRDEFVPVHGVYPCEGNDAWIAIAARTEGQWNGLCEAMGRPAWTGRLEFAGPAQRTAHQGELNGRIAHWTRQGTPAAAVAALQRHGVPARPVNNIRQVMEDPQIKARGAFQPNPHPIIGAPPAYASPVVMDGVPRTIRRGAPLWGEHNDHICRDLLGLSHRDVARLVESQALS